MRQKEYVDNYLEPEIAARIKKVISKRIHRHLDQMEAEDEDEESIPNPNDDLQKGVTNYGVKWLDIYAAREKAKGAVLRRKGEQVRYLTDLKLHLTNAPVHDQSEPDPEDDTKQTALDLLAAARANLREGDDE